MRTLLSTALLTGLLAFAPTLHAKPKGLAKRAKPASLSKISPKILKLETELLQEINTLRKQSKAAPLKMTEPLRDFVRNEAELAARGDPKAKGIANRVAQGSLAPHGYQLQYAYGKTAKAVLRDLRKDPPTAQALIGDFQRAGVGAFWVPVDKPYFQVVVMVVRDQDPMAGKPGLSAAQVKPVMERADQAYKSCYDQALQQNPNIGGAVMLQIVIGAGGKVDSVKLLKPLRELAFDNCAVEATKRLQFPAPYKDIPVTLNHPLKFSPPHGERRIGELSPEQISGVFSGSWSTFKRCYDDRLKVNKKLAGTLELQLRIDGQGKLAEVTVKSDQLGDEPLRACVIGHTKQLTFPRPKFAGEVDVVFPLTFAAES